MQAIKNNTQSFTGAYAHQSINHLSQNNLKKIIPVYKVAEDVRQIDTFFSATSPNTLNITIAEDDLLDKLMCKEVLQAMKTKPKQLRELIDTVRSMKSAHNKVHGEKEALIMNFDLDKHDETSLVREYFLGLIDFVKTIGFKNLKN